MLESARELENAKVDFIVIPCNTAHAFVPRLKQNLKTPILSMVQVCVEHAIKQYPDIKKVGLLATCGTILSNIYNEEFAKKGITVVIPEENIQKQNVMQAIFGQQGIKAGNTSDTPHRLLIEAAHHLEDKGAEVILMACTEIPLVLSNGDIQVPLLDFTTLLAQAAVKKALGSD
jgi:aspartate racemase